MIELSASNAATVMSVLKQKLKSILDIFDAQSRVVYIDYPVHSNIGDLLINMGTEQFFRDYGITVSKRYSVLDMPDVLAMKVGPETTFLCHGGGNFGDLYPKHQAIREQLVRQFPSSQIVFLPQSLHYSSKEAQHRSLDMIAKHPNCHILLRDHESLKALQDAGVRKSALMPDMAHQLWETMIPTKSVGTGGDMCFRRRDMEAGVVPAELTDQFARGSVDWADIVSAKHRATAGAIYYLLTTCGRALPTRVNVSLWYGARDRMVADAVNYFSAHNHVYTNRLHAMILALLLGRDVSAFDNSYGKLSRYTATWLMPVDDRPRL